MKKRLLRKRPFVVLNNRKPHREDGGLDLALSNIIENAGSTNSARVVMLAVIDELVIPAVGGGDLSERLSRWMPDNQCRA